MTLSRLVEVRRYPYAEAAEADQQLLVDAGIEPHLKGYRHATLMVSEDQAEDAREILASSSHFLADSEAIGRCPSCDSADADPRPPYGLIVLVIGMAIAGTATVYGRYDLAIECGVATAMVSAALQLNVARWRCRSCGRLF
jgi:hypothetical protein